MPDRISFPRTRPELNTAQLADELLVFDPRTGQAHCLAPPVSYVFSHCDGHTDLEQLAAGLAQQGRPNPEGLAEECLRQLELKGLLQAGPEATSRRQFLGRAAAPLIVSMLAPRPVSAASGCIDETAGGGCNVGCAGNPGFPPAGCVTCCNAACAGHACGDTCPTCTGNCLCLTSINCAAGTSCNTGSCSTDFVLAGNANICDNPINPCCCRICNNAASPFNGESSCQRDCVRARGAAFCGGVGTVTQYSCCENCP
ncbi:MAG: hypothetical protein KC910_09005 [Candidatus Eremiobacteraeota bacterium]|nr:hypothetical protein [Candidatus Eremiobacteraeota bacterium]